MTISRPKSEEFCFVSRKRSFLKSTCWLLLTVGLIGTLHAEDFTYTTNNGALTITGYNGSGGPIIIPNKINGLRVTSIGQYAFFNCSSLTSVTIPDTVISIEALAFLYCSGLKNVSIPDSLTSIGDYAFVCCSSLLSISIPDNVTNVGDYAFQ